MKLFIEIDRIKNCGVDPTYDLVIKKTHKDEEENSKALCFDKEELLEKVADFISQSFIKD